MKKVDIDVLVNKKNKTDVEVAQMNTEIKKYLGIRYTFYLIVSFTVSYLWWDALTKNAEQSLIVASGVTAMALIASVMKTYSASKNCTYEE